MGADQAPGALLPILVADQDARAEGYYVAAGRRVDHHGPGQLVSEPGNLGLKVRLVVLGVVVLAVFL